MLPPVEQWVPMRGAYVSGHSSAPDAPEYRFWTPAMPEFLVFEIDVLYLPREWVAFFDARRSEPRGWSVHRESLELVHYRQDAEEIEHAKRGTDWYLVNAGFDCEVYSHYEREVVYSLDAADALLTQWCERVRTMLYQLMAGELPILEPPFDGRYSW